MLDIFVSFITLYYVFFPWPILYCVLLLFLLARHLLRHVLRLLLLLSSPFIWYFFILLPRWKPREIPSGPDPPYLSPFLFPVHPSQAFIASSNMVLSAIRIPIQWCHPQVQRSHKVLRHSRRHLPRRFWLFALLSLSQPSQAVHLLPGTNHALVHEASLDSFRQQSLQRTVVSNATSSHPAGVHAMPSDVDDAKPDVNIRKQPHCFVVDTDSKSYVLDTGANRFIVRDVKLLDNFQAVRGDVKGIGGTPVSIQGVGNLRLALQSDDGLCDEVLVKGAVYVPTSPFNLIPPQLLVDVLEEHDYDVDWFKHNNKQYVMTYRPSHTLNQNKRTITVDIDGRDMFTLWTKTGFESFFCKACEYEPEWKSFAGAAHVIPDNDDSQSFNPRETEPTQFPREPSSEKPREPYSSHLDHEKFMRDPVNNPVPFLDSDFDSTPSTPMEAMFDIPVSGSTPTEDPQVALVRRKQHRLAVIHERFGHLSFSVLKLMARAGLIPKDLATVDPPTCPGCAYGKAHRKPWRGKGIKNRKKLKTATAPGQVVSVDQLVSPTAGFVPTHRGKPTTQRYIGATVFVDHFSDFTYVHLMTKMDGDATVEAKLAFERVLNSHGVRVQHYHADNGLFDTKVFKGAVTKASQTLSFCGVNAHHQNGKAENRIKDVTQGARTALLHAAHRWPKAIDAALWPAALKNYVNLKNSLPTRFVAGAKQGRKRLPDQYDQSPLSKLSGTEVEANLNHFHPFGSPVYVLENSLQAQQSHNKWSDRSRVGIFMCHSPHHASNVPLVLNTRTGNVSPQFHCVYDDDFSTCKRDAKFVSLWQHKAKLVERTESDPAILDVLPTTAVEQVLNKSNPLEPPPMFSSPWELPTTDTPVNPIDPTEPLAPVHPPVDIPARDDPPEPIIHEPPVPTIEEPVVTRSGRRVRRNPRYFSDMHANSVFLQTFSPQRRAPCLLQPDVEALVEPHPLALMSERVLGLTASSDPDTMTLDEALNQPDREEFVKAMHKELKDHIERKHWKVIPLSAIPKHKRAIPMVWSMKRKRNPIGDIVKWKARLCAGGHRSIEMVDYWSTYSPVVSWNTVRLMVVFAMLNNWHMESIDFVLAFPQAPVTTDIYMKPPKVPSNFLIPDFPAFL